MGWKFTANPFFAAPPEFFTEPEFTLSRNFTVNQYSICTLSVAPKHPKWAYSTKRKTLYFNKIQRFG